MKKWTPSLHEQLGIPEYHPRRGERVRYTGKHLSKFKTGKIQDLNPGHTLSIVDEATAIYVNEELYQPACYIVYNNAGDRFTIPKSELEDI